MALQLLTIRNCPTRLAAGRYRLREADARICVADQQSERSRPYWLRQSLCAQVRRADRIRVVDDRGTTGLVTSDCQGEAERQDEPDEPEQRAL